VTGLINVRSVSLAAARIGIDRGIEQAETIGCRACIAVVDAAGNQVAYVRMDGAPYNSAQHALDKAYSAGGNGTATQDMWRYVQDDPQLNLGILKVQGLSVLGGGLPIVVDGELVGGVGASGSCGMAEDDAVAGAAVAAILELIDASGQG
jgi:uncharacterized protein GlcG (DUF336 family)